MFAVRSGRMNEKLPLPEQIRTLDLEIQKLYTALNGRMRFGDGTDGERGENISGEFQVVADTGTKDTEFTVAHTLGAIPIGAWITKQNKAGSLYLGTTAWTSTNAYFKLSTSDNAAITIWLLK